MGRMRTNSVVLAMAMAGAFASALMSASYVTPAHAQGGSNARGEKIAQEKCSKCHAVGKTDASPDRKAPPFRDIGKNFPLEHLAEALAEGIVTGDNNMPEFKFGPRDIDAILDYIAEMSSGSR